MSISQDVILTAIEQLRPRYRAVMAEFQGRLDASVRALRRDPSRRESMDEITFIAHRIAGTAANFGWVELGDSARRAETALTEAIADTRPCDLAAVEAFRTALEQSLAA